MFLPCFDHLFINYYLHKEIAQLYFSGKKIEKQTDVCQVLGERFSGEEGQHNLSATSSVNTCLALYLFLSFILRLKIQQESEWWAMQDHPQPPRLLFSLVRNIKISIISIINFIIINMLWYPANLVFQFSQVVLSMICGSSDQTTKLRASVLRLRQQVIFSKDQSFNIKSYKPSNRGKNDTAHLFLLQCFQKCQSLTLWIETGQTDRVGRGEGTLISNQRGKYWEEQVQRQGWLRF